MGHLRVVQRDAYWDLPQTDDLHLARWQDETVVGIWRLVPQPGAEV